MLSLGRSRLCGAPLRKGYALHRVRDTSSYFRTQITRVTDALISSTPGLPEAGAT
jgi:hypothetical protein